MKIIFFYFLKIIFDIKTSKQFKNTQKEINFEQKYLFFKKSWNVISTAKTNSLLMCLHIMYANLN